MVDITGVEYTTATLPLPTTPVGVIWDRLAFDYYAPAGTSITLKVYLGDVTSAAIAADTAVALFEEVLDTVSVKTGHSVDLSEEVAVRGVKSIKYAFHMVADVLGASPYVVADTINFSYFQTDWFVFERFADFQFTCPGIYVSFNWGGEIPSGHRWRVSNGEVASKYPLTMNVVLYNSWDPDRWSDTTPQYDDAVDAIRDTLDLISRYLKVTDFTGSGVQPLFETGQRPPTYNKTLKAFSIGVSFATQVEVRHIV